MKSSFEKRLDICIKEGKENLALEVTVSQKKNYEIEPQHRQSVVHSCGGFPQQRTRTLYPFIKLFQNKKLIITLHSFFG